MKVVYTQELGCFHGSEIELAPVIYVRVDEPHYRMLRLTDGAEVWVRRELAARSADARALLSL